jgi:nifR3 family TIM-barrel protein
MKGESGVGFIAPALKIGSLRLASPLCLSPLAGYTNLPFRLTLRDLRGVGLCTTDLVNARSLIERNRKALKLIETCPGDHPLAIQLFGAVPEEMRDAAVLAQELGADVVDVNMGCPVPKVCGIGAGSSLMRDHPSAAALVRGMVEAVRVPVTCKMRLGWDDQHLTAPELAKALQDVGVAGIFVHGRTRAQGYAGQVKLDGIKAVVEAVPDLPVIGNGDVTTPELAKRMMEETGCAGVSIGRGAFYNPWLFRDTLHYFATGERLLAPTLDERIALMRIHLGRMAQVFGEELGCRMFRKIGPWYAHRLGPVAKFRERITRLTSCAEFEEIVVEFLKWRAQFLDADGLLLPQYRPATQEPAQTISVPQGPVTFW